MDLRHAYIDLKENEYSRRISKEQQRRNSGEITEDEYELRYEAIMDERRLQIFDLLDNKGK